MYGSSPNGIVFAPVEHPKGTPVKYAPEKQKIKKVSQGKLSCYRSKFHGVNPVQQGARGKPASPPERRRINPPKQIFHFRGIPLKPFFHAYYVFRYSLFVS